MKSVLIVGSGDVAERALPWLVKRFRVFALVRDPERAKAVRALGARAIDGDLDNRSSLHRLAGIADLVLHFAPPPGNGGKDRRTAALAAALATRRSLPQRVVYISTTGVYGDCAGAWVDETRPCRATTVRARRRVDAERRLRRLNRSGGPSVSILRAPGIYAADRLPVARLERGDPVLLAQEDVYTNHIHADDLARLACLALFRGRPCRVYNAVDASDTKMGDYFDLAADMFGMARPRRVTRRELEGELSPMALSFMSESRRLCGERILREFRVALRYPTVNEGLAAARALRQQGDLTRC
jgi:nucleoside-diphosphate-sugar epimerase